MTQLEIWPQENGRQPLKKKKCGGDLQKMEDDLKKKPIPKIENEEDFKKNVDDLKKNGRWPQKKTTSKKWKNKDNLKTK